MEFRMSMSQTTSEGDDSCRYWAFISYSSKDKKWAHWLHRSIETYGIPAQLVSRPTPAGRPAPKRFHPLFHDRAELPASADLGAVTEEALRASRYLIVVCSPNAAKSKWVNKEIETFQRFHRHGRILAIIVDGEPNQGGDEECFPHALRSTEPIAADARPEADGKNNAKLKLLAGMLGVTFDALKQRDVQRRIRRRMRALLLAICVLGMIGYTTFAFLRGQDPRVWNPTDGRAEIRYSYDDPQLKFVVGLPTKAEAYWDGKLIATAVFKNLDIQDQRIVGIHVDETHFSSSGSFIYEGKIVFAIQHAVLTARASEIPIRGKKKYDIFVSWPMGGGGP